MLDSVIKFVILSIIIIVVMHSLYSFLVKNLTVPKVKDLVHKPQSQYESILRSLTDKDERHPGKNNNYGKAEDNSLSMNQIEMKNELKSYIKDLKAGRNYDNVEERRDLPQKIDGGSSSTSNISAFDTYDVSYIDSVGTIDIGDNGGYAQNQVPLSHSAY
jgi:hypothetical protein